MKARWTTGTAEQAVAGRCDPVKSEGKQYNLQSMGAAISPLTQAVEKPRRKENTFARTA